MSALLSRNAIELAALRTAVKPRGPRPANLLQVLTNLRDVVKAMDATNDLEKPTEEAYQAALKAADAAIASGSAA